jgi:hypothetical protein
VVLGKTGELDFVVEVVWLFEYLDCVSDYVGMVTADTEYDICFVKISAVSGSCAMLGN